VTEPGASLHQHIACVVIPSAAGTLACERSDEVEGPLLAFEEPVGRKDPDLAEAFHLSFTNAGRASASFLDSKLPLKMSAVEVDHVFPGCMFGEVFPEHMSPGDFMHLNVRFDRFLAFSGTVAPPARDTPGTGLSPPCIRQGVERKASTHSPNFQPDPEFLSLGAS
jgi:hypothetical protein